MKTGIQISSLKPLLTDYNSVRKVMKKLYDMGFRHTQIQWIDPVVTPEEIGEALFDSGLISLGTQEKYDECIRRLDEFVLINRACKSDEVCISGIPDRFSGEEGMKSYIREMREHIRRLKDEGMKASFHAVYSDFRLIGGKRACEILLEEVDELLFVPDTNPIVKVMENPGEWIKQYAGRMRMIHMKDMVSKEPGSKLAPAGKGVIDFKSIVPACEAAGIEHALVEQESWDGDPFDAMKESYDYLESIVH